MIRRSIQLPPTTDSNSGHSARDIKLVFKTVLISEEGGGVQRTRREWSPATGLKDPQNLFQGKNNLYPGDRWLFPDSENVLQIHKIKVNAKVEDAPERPLYFLAIKIGSEWTNVRRGGN